MFAREESRGANSSPAPMASTIGKTTERAGSPHALLAAMDWLDLIQWPAMAVTVLAAWLVASTREHRREIGFWVFIASNALWIAWGWHARAWALILLQLCLAAMNVRGVVKAAPATSKD
jgi:hypothetical protein